MTDATKPHPALTTTCLALLACLLWSTAFAGVKVGLRYSPPLSFAGIRFMLSGVLLLPFWWRRCPPLASIRAHLRTILLVALFQTFLLYGLFYFGMTLVSGALAAIIFGASPLIAAVVAHFFMADDELSFGRAGSLGLGVAGVALIGISRQPWASPEGLTEFAGVLVLLAASVSGALGNILVARDRKAIDPIFLTSTQIFSGGALLLLLSLPVEGLPSFDLPTAYWGALIYLSVLSAVAFSLWFVLLKRPGVKVSDLNRWKFVIPVAGALLSWAVLPEESPRLTPVIGMAAIALSIVLYSRSAPQREPQT